MMEVFSLKGRFFINNASNSKCLELMSVNELFSLLIKKNWKHDISSKIPHNQLIILRLNENNFVLFLLGDYNTTPSCPRYVCPQCSKSFTSVSNLNAHTNYVCGKDPQFSCPVCHIKMRKKHNMFMHARKKHGLELQSK